LLLLPLRLEVGQPFDFRPLVSFGLALLASGASFIAMGVFFSSLTKNQIISAVLTFMGMMILICLYFLGFFLTRDEGFMGVLKAFFKSMSFIDMCSKRIRGKFSLKDFVYHLPAAVFWLSLTVKVLEARRWT